MRFSRVARPASLAFVTLALASALAACGGGAEDTSGAPAAAGVDKAALVAKLKETPEAKDVPDSTWDCMAAAMLKHGDQATLQGFVDGKVDVTNDFKAFGDKEAQIQREVSECE